MILREGENCWQNAQAERVAFLIDAAEYFSAFAHAAQEARQTIYIAGWDFDSRLVLDPEGRSSGAESTLGGFLNQLVRRNSRLHIYILSWDYNLVFLHERQWLPLLQFGWKSHRRIRFHMDGQHPMTASQHQKFVVIDDAIAFCGGLDLTGNRWDTSAHHPQDLRRTNPDNSAYPPFHDLQMAVAGETAHALGELFRVRWRNATGKKLALPHQRPRARWPAALRVEIEDCRVAVARTLAPFKAQKGVREVERLYLDAIAAAERWLYIETQYLTSETVCAHLGRRLASHNGPEVVIIMPSKANGWLEQSTMDAIRRHHLAMLSQEDRQGRLRVYWPAVGEKEIPVYVHSKLLICDNRLAVVGSANLSNRSMGFDSECCLAVEGNHGSAAAAGIENLRNRLLAEHLGHPLQEIAAACRREGSLIRVIETTGHPARCLKPLDMNAEPVVDGTAWVPDRSFLDPAEPFAFDRVIDGIAQNSHPRTRRLQVIKVLSILLFLLGTAALWRWTPLAGLLNLQHISQWASQIDNAGLLVASVVAVYVLGSLMFVPVTFLIGATAVILPPWVSLPCALLGCVLSAWTAYWVGRKMGRETVRRLTGSRLDRLNDYLARQGVWTVMMLRNLPVAPFTAVNIVAGMTRISQAQFLLGTALGMLPGIAAITLLAGHLLELLRRPGWPDLLVASGVVLIFGTAWWWMSRRLKKHHP